MNSVQMMLGRDGDAVACNQFMHWFRKGANVGDHCLCGKTFKQIQGKLYKRDRNAKRHVKNPRKQAAP